MVINLVIYSIWDGQALGLTETIWAVQKGIYDIMLPAETNIHDRMYCRKSWGKMYPV